MKKKIFIKKGKKIIEKNKKVQSISFPTRYKINPDGTREIIMNETNKFDIKFLKIA